MSATPTFDPTVLSPLQEACMDVLAARYRLGEHLWTFSGRQAPALRVLESWGLVAVMHGITEKTVRARLTDSGRAAWLSDDYEPPTPPPSATAPLDRDAVDEFVRMSHSASTNDVARTMAAIAQVEATALVAEQIHELTATVREAANALLRVIAT